MRFADLMIAFREGQNEANKRGEISLDQHGIAAVVRALRDEIKQYSLAHEFDVRWLENRFNEILCSDAEKSEPPR